MIRLINDFFCWGLPKAGICLILFTIALGALYTHCQLPKPQLRILHPDLGYASCRGKLCEDLSRLCLYHGRKVIDLFEFGNDRL
jgi:hypothetical protein